MSAPVYNDFKARFLKLSSEDEDVQAWITARLAFAYGERTRGFAASKRVEAALLMVAIEYVETVVDKDKAKGKAPIKSKGTNRWNKTRGSTAKGGGLDITVYEKALARLKRGSSGRLPSGVRRR